MHATITQGNVNGDHGPIFIGGGERSGKTLIRFMLSAHPSIAMTRRVNMWPNFFQRFGDLADEKNFERCLDAMLHYKHVRFLKPDPDRIRREFWQGSPTYARLFALFQEHHAEREDKPRWGDQTGYIERYADPIFAAYPTAKMIHMVRDPRDCYEASLTKSTRRTWKAGVSTANWLQSVKLAKRNQGKYPGRYKIIQFEKMVSQQEETLRDLCDFIGEPFTPAMLRMEDIPRFQQQQSPQNGRGQSPLSVEYIGRYLRLAPKSEVVFIQIYARGGMLAWGYPLAPIHFSGREKLRFHLVTWPINRLSLAAWRVSEAWSSLTSGTLALV